MKYFILPSLICFSSFVHGQKSGNQHYQQTILHNNVANAEANDQEVSLSVSGLSNAKADTYVAFFHVIQVGETADKTNALMMARINKFKKALAIAGIDTSAVRTDIISFVPKYDFNVINKIFSKTYNEVPDGFELQKNIIIRYNYSTDMDVIITAAASAEIYDLVKVDYFVNDVKKRYDQLRSQCLEVLKDRITSYEILGMKLDTLRKTFAEDFGTVLPKHRYGQYQAVARPSIDAVKKETTGTSFSKFRSAELTPSRYYEAVTYEEYDVVVNPVVDQPVVQLTYQIKVKFVLDINERAEQNNYLFIGPNGQLQKLDTSNP